VKSAYLAKYIANNEEEVRKDQKPRYFRAFIVAIYVSMMDLQIYGDSNLLALVRMDEHREAKEESKGNRRAFIRSVEPQAPINYYSISKFDCNSSLVSHTIFAGLHR
jgi:hypothetical protein